MTISTANASSATTDTSQTGPPGHLKPRRTLNRLALAGAGLVLGLLAQAAFRQESLWDGLLLYGLAAVLFARALASRSASKNYGFTLIAANTLTIRAGWQRNIGVWLILLALGVSIMGYTFFERHDARQQAWWLYLAGLGLFVAGAVFLTPGLPWRSEGRRLLPNRRIIYGLGLVVGLALLLRLYNFTGQPFGIWFDEAEAGLQARQIINNPNYRPVFYPAINVTGHLLTLYALALSWLVDNIYAMRLVSVLFGVAGVVAAYLFGRELRGPRFGLALAFFMAVARWPVNFSRIAMTGIDAPFFEFLSLFFLTRLLKRGHMRDALWAGLSLGLGLMFYTAFRLYIVALILFALVMMARFWPQVVKATGQGGWRRYMGAGAIIIAAIWLTTMPLIKYAIDNPDAFWYRTRQISIFTKRDTADLSTALWQSAQQHLLMFNFKGDRNGRHNLPGEPMLDPLMGALFVLGVGLALARIRNPANIFFLILFPLALAGGIFSVDFEAPQSLRSIAVMPAIIYFCGLAVAALGREAEQSLRPLPKIWLAAPAGLLAAYIIGFNGYTYLLRQANDFASWNAFSAPETITGRKMAELGPEYVYMLSPFLANHPTTQFLAPDIKQQQYIQVPDALPVRDPSGRPVAMFIHPDDAWIYEQAGQMYPNAQFEIFSGPGFEPGQEGLPSVYFVGLQPANLMAVRGLELRYWPVSRAQTEHFIAPLHSSRAYNVNVTWPQESPVESSEFVAEWKGVLYAPRYGSYALRLFTPGPGSLEVDGTVLLEGEGEQFTSLPLAQGNHLLQMRASSGPGQVALYWQPPGEAEQLIPAWALYAPPITNNGLLGSFYANNEWLGQPVLQRIDPFLDSYFHLIPLQRPYTVEWRGALLAPVGGVYRLGLRVVQEAELYLDNRPILTTTGPNEYTEAPVSLETGLREILIRYRDNVDRSRVHLSWIPPNGVFEPIPSQYLYPPMGRYPEPTTLTQNAVQMRPVALRHLSSLGGLGARPGQFLEPRDVAVMDNGNLVVADTGNRRVQIFDPQFNFLQELTGDEFPFEEPLAVGVNSRDEILVLDSTLQWVYRYDANGNFIDRFGGPSARLFHPRGLTVFEDDTVALADTGSARLALFDSAGNLVGSIGSFGNGPGQLNEPTDVLRDTQGAYFVVEAENDRIQRLDAAGNPLLQWSIGPAYAYNGPHLTFDPEGALLVTESQSDVLLRYSPNGILLDQWTSIDSVELVDPLGIYFDQPRNRLYITDIGVHQVHLFFVETAPPEATEN